MTLETATIPAPTHTDIPTMPVLSRNRYEGIAWYERFMAQVTPASGDAARFAAGLEAECPA